MRKYQKGFGAAAVAGMMTVALCAGVGVGSAFAATPGGPGTPGQGRTVTYDSDTANWSIPKTPTTNTVWKDANGNVVAANTEGAKQYKVITTWAEAWSTSGSDFLGLSNSAYYGNGGNGNATVTTLQMAMSRTTVGVWATDANVNPNAYNWNTFYNLYQQSIGADPSTYSDWGTVTSGANKSPDGGAYWNSESGVWCGFKYRPDVVTTNNNLSADATALYISYINAGKYSATAKTVGEGRNVTYEPEAKEDGSYDQSFAVYGDATYNPQVVSYANASFYHFGGSLYELADAADKVIKNTASNTGLAEGETLTWKTVNKLPRESRYTESATECALNYEKLTKGAAYYALAKINDGTVAKKKVALVNTDFSSDTLEEGTVKVVAFDYIESIGMGPIDGESGWLSLIVDQLTTSKASGDATAGDTGYQYYIATADELATCDAIYMPASLKNATAWQEWIEKYATTDYAKKAAANINYVVNGMPCATNGSNFTIEKTLYPVMATDCIYPELFPNMQLSTFWCDAIYHIKGDSLASAMSWIYAQSPLAKGASLTTLGQDYSRDALLAKFSEGYKYFQSAKTTDATLKKLQENETWATQLAPTATWDADDAKRPVASNVKVFRLYNKATSEHLWTTDENEYAELPKYGWTQEDVAWNSPSTSTTAVVRLYNPALGTHHYTADATEIDTLVSKFGWTKDKDGEAMFYGAAESASGATAVLGMYNGGLSQHLLTMDSNEYDVLAGMGWDQEGTKFYAFKA